MTTIATTMERVSATSELAARRAKAQSYFDRYPERKGQGPYVPSSTLLTPVKARSGSRSNAASSDNHFDRSIARTLSQSTGEHKAEVDGRGNAAKEHSRRQDERGDGMLRQWHSRGEGGSSFSSSLSTAERTGLTNSSSDKVKVPPKDRCSSVHAFSRQDVTSPSSSSNSSNASSSSPAFAALETYRAKKALAAAARFPTGFPSGTSEARTHHSSPNASVRNLHAPERDRHVPAHDTRQASFQGDGHGAMQKPGTFFDHESSSSIQSPKKRYGTTNASVPGMQSSLSRRDGPKICDKSKAQDLLTARQSEASNSVLSIEEIIQKHSPSSKESASLRSRSDRAMHTASPSVRKSRQHLDVRSDGRSSSKAPDPPSIAFNDESDAADDSDGSSIDSVELEVRQSLNIMSPKRRSISATLSSPLQGSHWAPEQMGSQQSRQQLSIDPRPQLMTPSLSAPTLSSKKSTPNIFLATRKTSSPAGKSTDSFSSDARRSASLSTATTTTTTTTTTQTPATSDNANGAFKKKAMYRSKSNATLGSFFKGDDQRSSPSSYLASRPLPPIPPLKPTGTVHSSAPPSPRSLEEMDPVRCFVQSSRLTRLLCMQRAPYAGKTVSIADVGDPHGHAVILFLGLGAVRYLAGLYDEMASALGLRLICIDRWGIGRTDDLSADRRGILEWSSVVNEVADRLSIQKFSLLAHSAGAPYAMATCLTLSHRIVGPVHLLAPWVGPTVESGYKWLKYVPDGVIRTAQAAEWRMQGWRLGTSLKLAGDASVGSASEALSENDEESIEESGKDHLPPTPTSSVQQISTDSGASYSAFSLTSPPCSPLPLSPSYSMQGGIGDSSGRRLDGLPSVESGARKARAVRNRFSLEGSNGERTSSPGQSHHHGRKASLRASLSSVAENSFQLLDQPWQYLASSENGSLPPPVPLKTPLKGRASSADVHHSDSSFHSPSPAPASTTTDGGLGKSTASATDLPTELLRASHAESGGSANDLLVILGRSSQKPWGFSYVDVRHPVRVWHGEKDERVSLSSVLWMERELHDCQVKLIKGANHGLMTNVSVVVEALEHVAAHAHH